MQIDFQHHQSAHCESGVASNLLRHAGLDVSEAMAFGLGQGLSFAYLPFIRINRMPLVAYRSFPGSIFKKATKALGARVRIEKFSDEKRAQDTLNAHLEKGRPVGAQVGVFWLPFFPPALRFHFNSHNLVVYGQEDGAYNISDPTIEHPVTCGEADLNKARFAKGALAPKGKLYYIEEIKDAPPLEVSLRRAIRKVCKTMSKSPVPIEGHKGIATLGKRVARWPELGNKRAAYHLAHLIRMQEEIGTGGGGFRFIYAAFLGEAQEVLGLGELEPLRQRLTGIGDKWRDMAVLGAQVCKGRAAANTPYEDISKMLLTLADDERALFSDLLKVVS